MEVERRRELRTRKRAGDREIQPLRMLIIRSPNVSVPPNATPLIIYATATLGASRMSHYSVTVPLFMKLLLQKRLLTYSRAAAESLESQYLELCAR